MAHRISFIVDNTGLKNRAWTHDLHGLSALPPPPPLQPSSLIHVVPHLVVGQLQASLASLAQRQTHCLALRSAGEETGAQARGRRVSRGDSRPHMTIPPSPLGWVGMRTVEVYLQYF